MLTEQTRQLTEQISRTASRDIAWQLLLLWITHKTLRAGRTRQGGRASRPPTSRTPRPRWRSSCRIGSTAGIYRPTRRRVGSRTRPTAVPRRHALPVGRDVRTDERGDPVEGGGTGGMESAGRRAVDVEVGGSVGEGKEADRTEARRHCGDGRRGPPGDRGADAQTGLTGVIKSSATFRFVSSPVV